MRRFTIVLFVAVSILLGAGAAVLANGEPAGKRRCDNTWCGPGDRECKEQTNWNCTLFGGCAGTKRCDQEVE